MKHLALLLLLSMVLLACGSEADDAAATDDADVAAEATGADSDGDAAAGRYKVESGMIEMTMDMVGDATITTWFDDYGARQATYVTASVMGQSMSQVQIFEDGVLTSYNLMDSTGMRMRTNAAPSAWMPTGTGDMPDIASIPDSLKQLYNLKEIGTETIAGEEAQGYSMSYQGQAMKFWLWNNLPLRMTMDMGGQEMKIEATKVETNIDVPEEKFTVPAYVKITEQ